MCMNSGGIICLALGILGFIMFLISISVVGYIDDRVEQECDTEIGTIGQIIGADEGQCQDARNSKDFVKSLQLPLLGVGALFGLSGGMLIIRDY